MRYMILTYLILVMMIDDLYIELYDSLVKVKKDLKNKLAKDSLLRERIKQLEKENHDLNTLVERLMIENKRCYECEIYKAINNELAKALQDFTNNKNRLNDMLNN